MSLKDNLKDYIFRKLGIQIHEVFLTEEQLEDCITDSIEYFQEYSTMTTQESFILKPIYTGIMEYEMPSNWRTVLEVLPAKNPLDIFSIERHIVDNSIFNSAYRNTAGYSLLDVYLTRSWIQQARNLLGKTMGFSYNKLDGILRLHETPQGDTLIIVEGYSDLYDPTNDDDKIYAFQWVKKWALAQAWITLGTNLSLYKGTPLPAGLTFDSDFALTRGDKMVEELTKELEERYMEPPRFTVG